MIAGFHQAEAALLFNSGYDANIGLLSSVAGKEDTILYDFLSHASIRDGIRLSQAQSFPFLHNDMVDLDRRLRSATGNIFVVTESVFSMDGDEAPLVETLQLCKTYNAHLIVDEAHATGVTGPSGAGLVQQYQLQNNCFARVVTFGKALGCHGATVLGSHRLRDFLINFSRPFIYTTAMPQASLCAIKRSYELFPGMFNERQLLNHLIDIFQAADLAYNKLNSRTAIQGVIVPGNEAVTSLANRLQEQELDVRPILYPTVPRGSERLRIVLHTFNTREQLGKLTAILS
jgi:8-amino-7-oxononanoate synthase